MPPDYLTSSWSDLGKGARALGYALTRYDNKGMDGLRAMLARGMPVLCLVYYPLLPTRYDANYKNYHYVLVVGIEGDNVIYHDPYWRKGLGAYVMASVVHFDRAWSRVGSATGGGGASTPRQAAYIAGMTPFAELVDNYDLAKELRWNLEETKREMEAGKFEEAERRVATLITKAYALEDELKAA